MDDWFASHLVDVRAPGSAFRLALALRTHGVATFGGVTSRHEVRRIALSLLAIAAHRDAEPDGLTAIALREALSQTPGCAGFGAGELRPHTESTALVIPPAALMLVCAQPAYIGGETLLVDGGRLYDSLSRKNPALLESLSAPRSAQFGGSAGHLGTVFCRVKDGRVAVRFRDDPLVCYRGDITRKLPMLRSAIAEHTITLRLEAGQGLLLSNTRWLHGRTAYTGPRLMYRILGNPVPPFDIPVGFRPLSVRRMARSL